MKKALIFDLDDTIYPVKSVVDQMYEQLFVLISSQVSAKVYQNIRKDILTTPFQDVADRYALDKQLKEEGLQLCLEMEYNGHMKTFENYALTKDNDAEKFLVTAGYTKLQQSKIKQLGIENDFQEIFIADPYISNRGKIDVFKKIMQQYHYLPGDVLVIGDNPDSELAAGQQLGMETYLYDYERKYSAAMADHYGVSYENLKNIIISI